MKVTLQLYNCLTPEFLVTVQLSNPLHLKVLKGIEPNTSLDKINVSNKHAVISQEFDISSEEGGVRVVVAWPKERRFVEWIFTPEEYNEDLAAAGIESSGDNCFKYYITKNGIGYERDGEGGGRGWKKLKKIEELRSSLGRIVEISCIEDTTQLQTAPNY